MLDSPIPRPPILLHSAALLLACGVTPRARQARAHEREREGVNSVFSPPSLGPRMTTSISQMDSLARSWRSEAPQNPRFQRTCPGISDPVEAVCHVCPNGLEESHAGFGLAIPLKGMATQGNKDWLVEHG